jgi:multidrug efflux pump subunit AcrA (membrane-fusion protein)
VLATSTPSRLAAILLVAAAEALSLVPSRAASADLSFEFRGVVEPMQSVTIASHLNGIVDEVLFTPGATVAVGDPLFRIDPKEFEIALAAARAAVDEAEARLDLAADAGRREAGLLGGASGSRVRAFEAEVERRIAEARLRAAEAALAAASWPSRGRSSTRPSRAGSAGRSSPAAPSSRPRRERRWPRSSRRIPCWSHMASRRRRGPRRSPPAAAPPSLTCST